MRLASVSSQGFYIPYTDQASRAAFACKADIETRFTVLIDFLIQPADFYFAQTWQKSIFEDTVNILKTIKDNQEGK